jgi:hypothetical protein
LWPPQNPPLNWPDFPRKIAPKGDRTYKLSFVEITQMGERKDERFEAGSANDDQDIVKQGYDPTGDPTKDGDRSKDHPKICSVVQYGDVPRI